jgi:serine/threonine-protein kinase HipA
MRKADIYMHNDRAGVLWQDDEGYHFAYDVAYQSTPGAKPISVTLPLLTNIVHSPTLFPFFDGLIPEGWLLDIAEHTWKLNPRDRMGLLLACCRDCIGAVSIQPLSQNDNIA